MGPPYLEKYSAFFNATLAKMMSLQPQDRPSCPDLLATIAARHSSSLLD